MTLAWYGHLKFLHGAPLWQAILFGWLIALDENHAGSGDFAGFCAFYDFSI